AIGERVVLRQRDVELLPRDRVAAVSVEVEVEPHRTPVRAAAVRTDRERHAIRRMRAPTLGALESIEQACRARERRRRRLRTRARPARNRAEYAEQCRQPATHPFTLPAITPWM